MKQIDLSNVREFTKFKNPVGGFICKIVEVQDVPEKEYLKIYYDIIEAPDPTQAEFVGMYSRRKEERQFDYPFTVASYKESSLAFFKGFVTALENSNDGYKFDNDESKMVGLKIGFVLGEEEYKGKDKNGEPKVKIRTYVAERHSVDTIRNGEFETPEFKKLEQKTVTREANPFATNGSKPAEESPISEPMPAGFEEMEDECPF